jgi:hypothetical protein
LTPVHHTGARTPIPVPNAFSSPQHNHNFQNQLSMQYPDQNQQNQQNQLSLQNQQIMQNQINAQFPNHAQQYYQGQPELPSDMPEIPAMPVFPQ